LPIDIFYTVLPAIVQARECHDDSPGAFIYQAKLSMEWEIRDKEVEGIETPSHIPWQ